MPIRGPIFESLVCVAIAVAGIGCAKAEFDAADAGAPTCSVPTGVCTGKDDPCAACGQKCSYVVVSGSAQAACVTPQGDLAAFSACENAFEGTPKQTDQCGAGNVCLRGENAKFCFPLCSESSNCVGGVVCAPRLLSADGPSVNVCDPPYVQYGDSTFCDPLDGTCGERRYCFLVSEDSSGQSRTVCEYAEGNGRDDPPATCQFARDCFEQFTCVGGWCKRVCQVDTPCLSGQMCIGRGAQYGYCP